MPKGTLIHNITFTNVVSKPYIQGSKDVVTKPQNSSYDIQDN